MAIPLPWPSWRKFENWARFCLPIILIFLNLSIIDIFAIFYDTKIRALTPDLASVIFILGISAHLNNYETVIAHPIYTPENRYIRSFMMFGITHIYSDLATRFIWIPLQYFLYYMCMSGWTATILRLTFIYLQPFEYFININWFLNISKTPQGFYLVKNYIAIVILVGNLIYSRKIFLLFSAGCWIRHTCKYIFGPIIKLIFKRKNKKSCYII